MALLRVISKSVSSVAQSVPPVKPRGRNLQLRTTVWRWLFRRAAGLFSVVFCSAAAAGVAPSSVCGNGEVDRNPGLGLNRVNALIVRFEMPLFYRFLGSTGQDWRTAEHMEILD